jgi:hypothetical protein
MSAVVASGDRFPGQQSYPGLMILHAMLEQTPSDHTGQGEQITRETSVEADTYDTAWAQLHAELPDGWRVLWVRTTS